MLWSFILVASLSAGRAAADEGSTIAPRRVRGVDAPMRAVLEEGCRRSPVFTGSPTWHVTPSSSPSTSNGGRSSCAIRIGEAGFSPRVRVSRGERSTRSRLQVLLETHRFLLRWERQGHHHRPSPVR